MANLAQTEEHTKSLPSPTFNRETTMPRSDTRRADLEVNARIERPDTSNADALARILGVASQAAQDAYAQDQSRRDTRDAAQAAQDFTEGSKDSERFAKSIAYRNAWQLQGVKRMAVDIGAEAAQKLTERLNDSDNPATPEDVDSLLESIFRAHTTDAQGKLIDFGTPEAKVTLANGLATVRAQLVPKALEIIRHQQDARFEATWAHNNILEWRRGAPIGAKPVDPLAPLPEPKVIPAPAPGAPAVGGKPIEPFSGFDKMEPTSGLGAPRQGGSRHNGEDYPIPTGTALVSPMAGKVIASFSNARGGNQVRVKMADGAIIGYAHLSKRDVKVGDTVSAGEAVGLSGATGDATGPHVHMTVEVNGKKVSAKHYFAHATVPSGLAPVPGSGTDNIQLATVPEDKVPAALPPFDFEKAMAELPPSIDKSEAKKFLLQAVINEAQEKGDIGILAGLENSHRADGTPSFTPDEVSVILKAREEVGDKARVDADRAQRELWQQNGDALLTAMVSHNPPSDDAIARAAEAKQIDPSTAYTLIEHNQAAAREAAAEQRMEERQAEAEANAGYDAFTAGAAAELSVGDLSGPSPDALFKSGKLGPPGKKALARYHQLRAAQTQGEQRNRENPLYAQYMGQLKMHYGASASNPFIAPQFRQAQSSGVNFYAMTAFYKLKVSKGLDPEEAYLETIQKFGPPKDAADARRQLLAELKAKAAQP